MFLFQYRMLQQLLLLLLLPPCFLNETAVIN